MCHPEKKKRWKEVGQGKLGLCALEVQSHILFRAHTQALTHTHTLPHFSRFAQSPGLTQQNPLTPAKSFMCITL